MCGICGCVRWGEAGPPDVQYIRRIRDRMAHRGPDDRGLFSDGRAALGATRLAIRGGAGNTQPVVDRQSGVAVVCNGEIDNHAELAEWLRATGTAPTGEGDLAVLPHLYLALGESFVERLDGAFALALWDPRHTRLILARDRSGERPLFYTRSADAIVFASELSALVSESRLAASPDISVLQHYLRFGRFSAPSTPLRDVLQVPASHAVRLDPENSTSRKYWHWDLGQGEDHRPTSDAFDDVFRRAVRRQTACDVSFGLFLSGGVDSSLVAAVAREIHPDRKLNSYTLRFREASYDEGARAAQVAHDLGLNDEVVWVSPEDLPRTLRHLVRLVGEPLADPAWVPTALLARRAAQDVKLVLVGDGGDELFGGYPTHLGTQVQAVYRRIPAPVRRKVASLVRRLPPSDRKTTVTFLLKRFIDGDGSGPLARHLQWTSVIPPHLLDALGLPIHADAGHGWLVGNSLDNAQRHDFENLLADGLLTKTDRALMSVGVEPRAPFLDREVVEFAATLPRRERVRGLRTKVFLKRYAARYLPSSIVHRRKQGLSVPLSAWLRGPLEEWAGDRLKTGRLERCGARTAVVLRWFEEHRSRRADHGRALWSVLVLIEWLEWLEELDVSAPSETNVTLPLRAPTIAR